MKRFRLSPEAADDISEIWRFIAENNIDAAERVRGELLNACRLLNGNPDLGHGRPDLTPRAVRFWPVSSYVIIYREKTASRWKSCGSCMAQEMLVGCCKPLRHWRM